MRARLGVTIQQRGDLLHLVSTLNVAVARVNCPVYDILPHGPDDWHWEWLDHIVDECLARQLIPNPVIGKSAPWQNPDPGDLPPVSDWQRFCLAFAQHFKGRVTFVSIWNEFQGSASEYVTRLLRPAADAFRSTDPRYRLCGPELSTEGHWPAWLRSVLMDGSDCLDVVTAHCYAKDGQAVWNALTKPRSWFEQIFLRKKPSLKQVLEEAGWTGAVWVTETGFQSEALGDSGQANAVDQLLERLEGSPWPHGVALFQLIDEPGVTFGVYDEAQHPKPAVSVIQRYTNTLTI